MHFKLNRILVFEVNQYATVYQLDVASSSPGPCVFE